MMRAHRPLDRVPDDAVHTLDQSGDHPATIPALHVSRSQAAVR